MQTIILGFSCLIGGFIFGYWIDEIFHKDKPVIKEEYENFKK